jgi:hypothetical protein
MSNYEKIYEFVKKNPNSNASVIAKALNIDARKQNIYSMLKPMVKRMQLFKTRNKKYVAAPHFHIPNYKTVKPRKPVAQVLKNMDKAASRMPLYSESNHQPSALEKIFQAEIEYIDSGIESLQITRSYIQRRIEQIRADGKA